MKLNIKNYLNHYAFTPHSSELSKADQKRALSVTIALGILSLGLFPAAVAIVNLIRFNGKVSLPATQRITIAALPALLKPEEVAEFNLTELLQELCDSKCTLERLAQILQQLKAEGRLAILNSIPNAGNQTPLQYWIQKGNLEAVKQLIEHGAAVRIEDESFSWSCNKLNAHLKSALFQAAQSGQVEIVKYLLRKGARGDFAFHNREAFHFIPVYIYTLAKAIKNNIHTPPENASDQCKCLRLILNNLSENERVHQFRIPVDHLPTGYINAIDWIDNELKDDSQAKMNLLDVLNRFEIKKGEVCSVDHLSDHNYLTIGELVSYK